MRSKPGCLSQKSLSRIPLSRKPGLSHLFVKHKHPLKGRSGFMLANDPCLHSDPRPAFFNIIRHKLCPRLSGWQSGDTVKVGVHGQQEFNLLLLDHQVSCQASLLYVVLQ